MVLAVTTCRCSRCIACLADRADREIDADYDIGANGVGTWRARMNPAVRLLPLVPASLGHTVTDADRQWMLDHGYLRAVLA